MPSYRAIVHSWSVDCVDVKKIKYNPNQIKIQTEEKVSYLVDTIEEIGFLPTIIVDENFVILDGHAVFMAVEVLELKQIPVIILKDFSEREKELLIYAACETSHMIQWQQSNVRNPWEVKHV